MSNATKVTADFIKAIRLAARAETNSGREYYIKVEGFRTPSWNGTLVTLADRRDNGPRASEPYTTFFTEVSSDTCRVAGYGSQTGIQWKEGSRRFVATQTHYSSSDRSLLRSLASIIKVGDDLVASFILDNSSDYTKNAGLGQDECYIVVVRNGKIVCDLYVDDIVGPDNSVRMGYQYSSGTGYAADVAARMTAEVEVSA